MAIGDLMKNAQEGLKTAEQAFTQAVEVGNEEMARAILKLVVDFSDRCQEQVRGAFGPQKLKPEEAKEFMGDGFYFGSEALEKTWGMKLAPEQMPAIPFSREDLEGAKRIGQFLELRPKGITMEEMEKRLAERFQAEEKGKILYDKNWYQNEVFFKQDQTELEWALVTKQCIPGSKGKNAVGRTRATADYLTNQVFKGKPLPADYAEAVAEFEGQEAELTGLMRSDWKECNRRLSQLKLNQLCRRTPAEALFDTNHHLDNTGERVLENEYDCTPRLSSFGASVYVGGAASAGASVNRWHPDDGYPKDGVVFARSY